MIAQSCEVNVQLSEAELERLRAEHSLPEMPREKLAQAIFDRVLSKNLNKKKYFFERSRTVLCEA